MNTEGHQNEMNLRTQMKQEKLIYFVRKFTEGEFATPQWEDNTTSEEVDTHTTKKNTLTESLRNNAQRDGTTECQVGLHGNANSKKHNQGQEAAEQKETDAVENRKKPKKFRKEALHKI